MQKIILLGIFCACTSAMAQQAATIDTVYIFDTQLQRIANFHKLTRLSAAEIQTNSTNLAEVLRFQSPLYIKENGRGATASPAFRGTTAQQTALVWNGININSAFLGQGALNQVGILTADEIDIKAGGGSVIYGSGAIGGSIHVNNQLSFNQGLQASLFSEIGSFDTFNNVLKTSFSNKKLSVKFAGSYVNSQNDYQVEEEDYHNLNGQYRHTNINLAAAYKISPHHQISWLSQHFDGVQHYPIFSENQTKSKYKTANFYNLLSWNWRDKKFKNDFKLAFIEENFDYFAEVDRPKSSGGRGKHFIVKENFNYYFSPQWNFNLITSFKNEQGEGYQSGISQVSRNSFSIGGLVRYLPTKTLGFEIGFKKDFVEQISSPWLFSFAGKWQPSKAYTLGLNFSKNFRYPSFNDLYWEPGGNIDLKPETSYQITLDNQVKLGDFSLQLTPYFMKISHMIRWLPTTMNYWAPVNTNRVNSYGLESALNYRKHFGKNHLSAKVGYAFTRSINNETQKQLMYVPLHKVYGNLNFQRSIIQLYVQGIYNGLTYTDTVESLTTALQDYVLLNAGVKIAVGKHLQIGAKANNLLNTIYATTAYYYMPKRNYSFQINIKF